MFFMSLAVLFIHQDTIRKIHRPEMSLFTTQLHRKQHYVLLGGTVTFVRGGCTLLSAQ